MTSVARVVKGSNAIELKRSAVPDRAPWSSVLFMGVLALVLWAPVPFGSGEPWALGILRVGALALGCVWLAGAAIKGSLVVDRSPLQVVLLAAIGFGLFQLYWSGSDGQALTVDPFSTRQMLVTLASFTCFFAVSLVAIDSEAKLRFAALSCFWFAVALSVFAVIQDISGTKSIYWWRDTTNVTTSFFGPFVNKNHFAGLIELWLPIGAGMVASGAVPRQKRLLTAFACVICVVAIALSKSRAGLVCAVVGIAAAAGLAVLGAWRLGPNADRKRLVLGAVGLAIAISIGSVVGVRWIGSEPVVDGFSKLSGELDVQEAISRPGMWSDTWKMITDRPLLGHGLGAYAVGFTRYGRAVGSATVLQSHNDYLQVLAEMGVFGAILLFAFIWFLGLSASRGLARKQVMVRGVAVGAAAGCVALMLHEAVDFNLQIPSNALAFLFSVALIVKSATLGREPAL